jgi:hypothetical protein
VPATHMDVKRALLSLDGRSLSCSRITDPPGTCRRLYINLDSCSLSMITMSSGRIGEHMAFARYC